MALISPELTYTQATKILHEFGYWQYYDRGYCEVDLYIEKLNKKADCLNTIFGNDLGWAWQSSSPDKLTSDSKYRIKIEYRHRENEDGAMKALLEVAGIKSKPTRKTKSSDEEEYY